MVQGEDFLIQLKEGQPAAYEVLVDRFEGPLYRFFFCDHRNHHLAAEQTAETFAELVRSLPKMRGSHEQLRAFVFATARHVQGRNWRRPKRKHVSLTAVDCVRDGDPSPLARLADRERVAQVLDAIGRLDQP